MADTSVQNDAAKWICESCLPDRFHTGFSRQRVKLSCGGTHSFAAVSVDLRTVGTICTGAAATPTGHLAVGKLNKVRADLYFLLLAKCDTRFIAVTGPIMYQLLLSEQTEYRRIPADIEIIHVTLPPELQDRLERAQKLASEEVRPG